jgi:hypothetical protein
MAIKVGGTTVIDDSRNLTVVNSTPTGTLTTKKISETLVAVGNSGTAATIDLSAGTVFTVTLNGNATLTITNTTGAAAFTVILTNDGTPDRSITWAASGGSFKFPGGAAALSRTTTASGVDVWVFFSPDGGTTWYGNIAMKNMTA